MDSKVEQRANVKFCVKLGKSATETFGIIRQVYGDAAMSRSSCFEWHARFKSGRTSVEDDERSGRPATSSTPENIETIRQLAGDDRRRTIHDIADIVGVSYGTVQEILTRDMNTRKEETRRRRDEEEEEKEEDEEREEGEEEEEREEKEEEEEDYMSDAFLHPALDVRPGVPMVKRLKETLRKETLHKEKNLQNQQKSFREQERISRDAALQNSLNSENKGFTLLKKMGYTAGQGLGREGTGRVEPIPLNIKTDRGGIGMEEERKRKAEENFNMYRKRLQVKQDVEKRSLEDFRERKRTEQENRETEADLSKSQRACEQLDRQKGITVPRDHWYWPEEVTTDEEERDECEECEELDAEGSKDDAELTSLAKLQYITSYLRSVHVYCVWCGTAYGDEEDLNMNCPGCTASKHLE